MMYINKFLYLFLFCFSFSLNANNFYDLENDIPYKVLAGVSKDKILYSYDACSSYKNYYNYYLSNYDLMPSNNQVNGSSLTCSYYSEASGDYIELNPTTNSFFNGNLLLKYLDKISYFKDYNKSLDVVVLYEDKISKSLIDNYSDSSLDQLSVILKGSLTGVSNLDYNIIDYIPFNISSTTVDYKSAISNIYNNSGDFVNMLDKIKRVNADVFVVVFKTFNNDNPDLNGISSILPGVFSLIPSVPNDTGAYGNYDNIKPNPIGLALNIQQETFDSYVFSHEFGHLMGLSHDSVTDEGHSYGGTYNFSKGKGWTSSFSDEGTTTIMGYPYNYAKQWSCLFIFGNCDKSKRNPYFSNPYINLCGGDQNNLLPCGVNKYNPEAESADSVSAIKITLPQILRFKDRDNNIDPFILKSTTGNDILLGSNIDDIIDLQSGDDTIYISNGNDSIILGSGSDIIVAQDREGVTIIEDFSEFDSVKFENSSSSDYVIEQELNNLLIKKDTISIVLKDFYLLSNNSSGYDIKTIDNHEYLTFKDLGNLIGDEYNNVLIGDSGINNYFGNGGNDTLGSSTQNSSNPLWNGDNSGVLGNYGDSFNGGTGDDVMYGTRYGDKYYFSVGDGIDSIYDFGDPVLEVNTDWQNYISDEIIFTGIQNVNSTDVFVFIDGNDLILENKFNTNDKIILKNQLYSEESYSLIEKINFYDKTIYTQDIINNLYNQKIFNCFKTTVDPFDSVCEMSRNIIYPAWLESNLMIPNETDDILFLNSSYAGDPLIVYLKNLISTKFDTICTEGITFSGGIKGFNGSRSNFELRFEVRTDLRYLGCPIEYVLYSD